MSQIIRREWPELHVQLKIIESEAEHLAELLQLYALAPEAEHGPDTYGRGLEVAITVARKRLELRLGLTRAEVLHGFRRKLDGDVL